MSELVKYETPRGEVELSIKIVRDYLVNGDPSVTDQEIIMFMQLCKYQKINPFLREAYLIKYKGKPSVIVTGKDLHLKRARRNPDYKGHKAWVEGNMPDLKGIAEVYVKDYQTPIRVEVDYAEYVQKHYDEKTKSWVVNQNWKKMPRTMLRKVALVQALREAFPEDMSGLYCPEEMPIQDGIDLDSKPVSHGETIEGEIVNQEEPPTEPIPHETEPEQDIPLDPQEKFSGKYIVPFGKYAGKGISELADHTLKWVVSNIDPKWHLTSDELKDHERNAREYYEAAEAELKRRE